MVFGSIIRFCGRAAVFAALAALLWQASCTLGLTALAKAEVAAPAGSGCHDSAPATPNVPSSGQKCCNGEHSPDALLNPASTAPAPLPALELAYGPLDSSILLRHAAEIVPPAAGPPLRFTLRI